MENFSAKRLVGKLRSRGGTWRTQADAALAKKELASRECEWLEFVERYPPGTIESGESGSTTGVSGQ
jgi:hypothetical protein